MHPGTKIQDSVRHLTSDEISAAITDENGKIAVHDEKNANQLYKEIQSFSV